MKKLITLFAFTILICYSAMAQMVLTYQIKTANTLIQIPLSGTVDVTINWGDGTTVESFTTPGEKFHLYSLANTYTITISGKLTHFGTSTYNNPSLISVQSWDNLGLTSLAYAFYNAKDLISVPSTLPNTVTDLSYMFYGASLFNHSIEKWNTENVTNMQSMFYNTSAFNQPIGDWNVSSVTDMGVMFAFASSFNQPISDWNTANVKNMFEMFMGAESFNQPIGNWNTRNVINMGSMFMGAESFNQPIENWNTSSDTLMSDMFYYASSFNQPIDGWNTGNVINMEGMFGEATSFNQPIGNWNTENVKDMYGMFAGASSFNQPLGNWNVTNVNQMNQIFYNDTLCTENYNSILNGWASQNVKSGMSFDGGGSKYSVAGADARATLISKGWTIKDGGLDDGTSVNPKCLPTEIEESLQAYIQIYPNPSNGQFVITSEKPIGNIAVYNAVGALVYQSNTSTTSQNIDLKTQSEGIYFIKIGNVSHKVVLSF